MAQADLIRSKHTDVHLQSQWEAQVKAVTQHAPGLCHFIYHHVLNADRMWLGASKVAAAKMAQNIIGLQDSLSSVEAMINENANKSVESEGPNAALDSIESSLSLEDLRTAAGRLKERITRSLQLLTGKDSATGDLVKKALKNEQLGKVYKCRAVQLRLASRVRNNLMAAVPFRRRISRAKKGGCYLFMWA